MQAISRVAALTLFAGCAMQPAPEAASLPPWLTTLITELENQPAANPPHWIARYTYREQTVYYLSPRCCDIPSILYDAEGSVLCNPDGGFSGDGDGRCRDFSEERRSEVIVWRDTRHSGDPAPALSSALPCCQAHHTA